MYELNFRKNTNRYSVEELLKNIEIVWNYHKKQPITNDMNKKPSKICFTTYFNRFGCWKNALEEFVKYKNDGKILYKKIENKTGNRKTINNSLRYKIMNRDNFKCVLCGESPATNQNIKLEIDHIIPISKGGDNSIKNLRTVCKKCNIGKFDKLEM